MVREIKGMIGNTGNKWRRIGNNGRKIHFPGIIETHS